MAVSASAANSGSTTGFLDLPPEIRNAIYELALTPNPVIEISRITNDQFRKCPKDCACRNPPLLLYFGLTLRRAKARQYNNSIHLLRACKMICSAATPVIYGANNFEFMFDCHFVAFVDMIGQSAGYIQYVDLKRFETKSMLNSAFVRLRACKKLQKIKLSLCSFLDLEIPRHVVASKLEPSLKALKTAKRLRGEEFSTDEVVEVYSAPDFGNLFYEGLASNLRAELENELERLLN